MSDPTGIPRQKSLLPWLVAGVAVLAIGLTMYVKGGKDDTPAAAPESSAVETPAQPVRSGRAVRAPGQPMRREEMLEQRARMEQKRKDVQQQVDRTQAEFASRYQNERVDAAWAGAKEAELTRLGVSDQIRQLGAEPKNMAVDCKSSMCRITGDFATISSGDDWITLYMNNVGDKVPVASYKYVQNPDGTVTINVYAVGRK